MKTVCEICSKEFNIRPAKVKKANYCSHACYWESKKKQVKVNCLYCNAELSRKAGIVEAQGENHFCNIECRNLYRQGENHPNWVDYPKKDCVVCGEEIRHRLVRFETAKYCSRKCKSDAMAGENCKWWKDGSSFLIYPAEFKKSLKRKIKIRDGMICQVCGISHEELKANNKRGLTIHHIDYKPINCHPKNLIATCQSCNTKANYNREYWQEFFINKIENIYKNQEVPCLSSL